MKTIQSLTPVLLLLGLPLVALANDAPSADALADVAPEPTAVQTVEAEAPATCSPQAAKGATPLAAVMPVEPSFVAVVDASSGFDCSNVIPCTTVSDCPCLDECACFPQTNSLCGFNYCFCSTNCPPVIRALSVPLPQT